MTTNVTNRIFRLQPSYCMKNPVDRTNAAKYKFEGKEFVYIKC